MSPLCRLPFHQGRGFVLRINPGIIVTGYSPLTEFLGREKKKSIISCHSTADSGHDSAAEARADAREKSNICLVGETTDQIRKRKVQDAVRSIESGNVLVKVLIHLYPF